MYYKEGDWESVLLPLPAHLAIYISYSVIFETLINQTKNSVNIYLFST